MIGFFILPLDCTETVIAFENSRCQVVTDKDKRSTQLKAPRAESLLSRGSTLQHDITHPHSAEQEDTWHF